MFYFSWGSFIGFLFVFLLHSLCLLNGLWCSISLILAYKHFCLVQNIYLSIRTTICFILLSFFEFSNSLLFYFKLRGNEHCRHQLHPADFSYWGASQSWFWSKVHRPWAYNEQLFRVGCDSGSSSGEINHREYGSQDFCGGRLHWKRLSSWKVRTLQSAWPKLRKVARFSDSLWPFICVC